MTDQSQFYNSIGASQCAAVMGLDKNKTPYQLWREFLYPEERPNLENDENVLWGKLLQRPIAEEAAKRLGFKHVLHDPDPTRLANLDFVRASPDAYLSATPDFVQAGLEVKNRGLNMAKFYADEEDLDEDDASDAVLPTEALQAHHSMWVTDLSIWYVAVLLGGQRLRIFPIHRDQAVCNAIEQKVVDFWRMVQERTPPPPVNSDDAFALWPRHTVGQSIEADEDLAVLVENRRQWKLQAKELENKIDFANFEVKRFMRDAEELRIGGKKALTWKSHERDHFDLERFRAENPEMAAAYTLKKNVRVLR